LNEKRHGLSFENINPHKEYVFINGGGTVGENVARLYASAGVPVIVSKRSARGDDVKTWNLTRTISQYNIPLVVADDANINQFKYWGFNPEGRVKDLFESLKRDELKIGLIIDCLAEGADKAYHDKYYRDSGVPFIFQGKGPDDAINGGLFVSCSGTTAEKQTNLFLEPSGELKNSKIGSCNTHTCAYASAIIGETIGYENINKVVLHLVRREVDPEIDLILNHKLNMPSSEAGSHHARSVEKCLPQLKNKVFSIATKIPYKHFHLIDMVFELKVKSRDYIESIENAFMTFERCAYLHAKKLKLNNVYNKITKLGIRDGDCVLPLYAVNSFSEDSIIVQAVTPQRSIIAPSNLDYWFLHELQDWREAYDKTNKTAKLGLVNILELKQDLEEALND